MAATVPSSRARWSDAGDRDLTTGGARAPRAVMGIDIGTRNLSYCVLRADGTVATWALVDITLQPGTSYVLDRTDDLVSSAWRALHADQAGWAGVHTIVIESQSFATVIMQNIAAGLLAYLEVVRTLEPAAAFTVEFVHPATKYRDATAADNAAGGKGTTHARNKRISIAIASRLLNATIPARHPVRAFFDVPTKRDDLADSFLLARARLDSQRAGTRPPPSKRRRL